MKDCACTLPGGVLGLAILGARSKRQISEAQLSRWHLVEEFEERLERAAAVGKEPHSDLSSKTRAGLFVV